MANGPDKVHPHGMSPNDSTYMTVETFAAQNGKSITIEPPLQIIFEGAEGQIAFSQDGQTARYSDNELSQIGEGSSAVGMQRVIGDIAMNGKLAYGAIKPLHPGLVDGEVVVPRALPSARLEITV